LGEKAFGESRCEAAALNFLVEADDVDIRIGQERALGLDVKRDNTRATERFHPSIKFLGLGEPADFADELRLDALAFERRNEWGQVHSLSSSAFPVSSSARLAISFSWARRVSTPRSLYSR